jgi:hypothetical protein
LPIGNPFLFNWLFGKRWWSKTNLFFNTSSLDIENTAYNQFGDY